MLPPSITTFDEFYFKLCRLGPVAREWRARGLTRNSTEPTNGNGDLGAMPQRLPILVIAWGREYFVPKSETFFSKRHAVSRPNIYLSRYFDVLKAFSRVLVNCLIHSLLSLNRALKYLLRSLSSEGTLRKKYLRVKKYLFRYIFRTNPETEIITNFMP